LEEAAPIYKEVAAPFEEAAVVSGDAVEAPGDGVAGGALAAAGAELECDAAADGGVDAVSAGSGVSEEPAVSQGAVAGVPAADAFGEESAVGAGNPLLLPIVPRHRVSGGGARSEGQLAPEERAIEVGEAAEIAYLLPWDEVEDVEGVRGLVVDAVDSGSVESRVLEPVEIQDLVVHEVERALHVFEAAVGGVVVFVEVAALGFAVNEVGDEQPPVLLAAAAAKDTSETVKDAELWVKIVEGEDEGGLACYRSWKSVKRWFSQIIARQNPEELVGKETLAKEGATSEAEIPAEVDAAPAVAGKELAGPAEGEASVGKELPTPSKEEAPVEAKSAPTVEEERAGNPREAPVILEVQGLRVVVADTRQEILNGLDLVIQKDEL
jgi:hypothetical protein